MVDLMLCLTNIKFFDIPLLYYYTNINSSIICFIFSGDIYLSFGTSISLSESSFHECNSIKCNFLEDFSIMRVTLSAVLFSIKSPAASAVL